MPVRCNYACLLQLCLSSATMAILGAPPTATITSVTMGYNGITSVSCPHGHPPTTVEGTN